VLTGLMVLLFLGDSRGALIVVLTIPTSIISGVLFLYLFGQTINIMTLSGLALAIGILVDESTVTIENIHQHLDLGKPKALAIWDACKEIAFPKLLIYLYPGSITGFYHDRNSGLYFYLWPWQCFLDDHLLFPARLLCRSWPTG
jgi:hypothetical protein